jgi:hypothetical protein
LLLLSILYFDSNGGQTVAVVTVYAAKIPVLPVIPVTAVMYAI